MMPNRETVYHYSTHNGLATETTVDIVGLDGQKATIKVFLQDPLGVLKKNDTDVLGINVEYIEEGTAKKLVTGISDKQTTYNAELTDEILDDEENTFKEFLNN